MIRFLYAALSGTLGILVLLVGSWANSVSATQQALEVRVTRLENHYTAIQTRLQDIQDGLMDLNTSVKGQRGWITKKTTQYPTNP